MYANYVVNSTFQVGRDYPRGLRVTRNNPFANVAQKDVSRDVDVARRTDDEGTTGETDELM